MGPWVRTSVHSPLSGSYGNVYQPRSTTGDTDIPEDDFRMAYSVGDNQKTEHSSPGGLGVHSDKLHSRELDCL